MAAEAFMRAAQEIGAKGFVQALHKLSRPLRDAEEKRLNEMVAACEDEAPELLGTLVAHRGFHKGSDSFVRPLENTVEAYAVAWKSGFVI